MEVGENTIFMALYTNGNTNPVFKHIERLPGRDASKLILEKNMLRIAR
jgi:hypothetical protein